MLEAFDLLPVIDCLRLDNQDAVNACMDGLQPWLEIAEDGAVVLQPGAISGFIGGTVGVLGTIVSTMIKKEEVKDRLKCVYCDGSGQIICGHCLASREVATTDAKGNVVWETCENCEGTGTVVCINCQGSGMSIPEEFFQMMGDPEVGFTEEDYIGLFDETPIPKGQPPVVPSKSAIEEPKAVAAVGNTPDEGSSGPAKPSDFTGGMG